MCVYPFFRLPDGGTVGRGGVDVCRLVWFVIELEGYNKLEVVIELVYVFIWATHFIYSLSPVQLPYVKCSSCSSTELNFSTIFEFPRPLAYCTGVRKLNF